MDVSGAEQPLTTVSILFLAFRFYAKWCKKCQRLGRQFDRLAMEMGDRIVDQQFVDGDVRFAAIEYNKESHNFITEELQIRGFPTLQMYVGAHKLLEAGSSIKNITDLNQYLLDYNSKQDRY